jgi:60 kDa SS-A/Ro ribonucleoprotein
VGRWFESNSSEMTVAQLGRAADKSLTDHSSAALAIVCSHKEDDQMARLNTTAKAAPIFTHEGAPAALHVTDEQMLRRSVLSCLLWEKSFYEEGQEIADRIAEYAAKVPPHVLANLAIEARTKFNLRHAPLLLLRTLVKTGAGSAIVGETIAQTIRRADELSEFLSLYWATNDGKRTMSAQLKKGLATAFRRFDAYQLGKYDRANTVRLRDVLFLSHAKPENDERAALWKQLVANELESPDTWEVNLSGGADKKETFERLIREEKLGYLALLRNLRNMVQAGCDLGLVRQAILARKGGAERVLPFRYIAAARACPQLEPALDEALMESISSMPILSGTTAVLVDISGSMNDKLSAKSDLTRFDAAAALASVIHGNVRMFSFSDNLVEVPPRRGMAGIDALNNSQAHSGTRLFDAIAAANEKITYDRIIVITDEQSHPASGAAGGIRMGTWGLTRYEQSSMQRCPDPKGLGYMINVASARNGVGYGPWLHLDGFSEQVLRYIGEHEASLAR